MEFSDSILRDARAARAVHLRSLVTIGWKAVLGFFRPAVHNDSFGSHRSTDYATPANRISPDSTLTHIGEHHFDVPIKQVMTAHLNWDPSYSVGSVILDSQHERLLDLCAQVADCVDVDGPDSDDRFHKVLNDVGDYAFAHFKAEEAMLAQRNYPQLEAHKKEHMGFLSHLSEFLFAANGGHLDRAGLHEILSAWLSQHLLVSDMQYKGFLHANIAVAAVD